MYVCNIHVFYFSPFIFILKKKNNKTQRIHAQLFNLKEKQEVTLHQNMENKIHINPFKRRNNTFFYLTENVLIKFLNNGQGHSRVEKFTILAIRGVDLRIIVIIVEIITILHKSY